jgi:hypothetical protein
VALIMVLRGVALVFEKLRYLIECSQL